MVNLSMWDWDWGKTFKFLLVKETESGLYFLQS